MLLDDGGDATLMVHEGRAFELAGKVPAPTADDAEDWASALHVLAKSFREEPAQVADDGDGHPRRHRGDDDRRAPPLPDAGEGRALFPAMNVNDSVTKSKFDNIYGCRHSLVDGIMRATGRDALGQGRGRVRLRRRRQGLRTVAEGPGRARGRHRDRPDLRAAGGDGGLRRAHARGRDREADIFVTATGNLRVVTVEHMAAMKNNAIVGNIGHFDNEIDMAALAEVQGHPAREHQAAGRPLGLPRRPRRDRAREGRLLNLGCATATPRS
jgi:adenosylhomocysteinase